MQQYSLTSSGQVQSSHRFLIGPPLLAVLLFGFGFVLYQSHQTTQSQSVSRQATARTSSISTKKASGLHTLPTKPQVAAAAVTPQQLPTGSADGPAKISSISSGDYAPHSTANPQSAHSTMNNPQPAMSSPAVTNNSSPFGPPVNPSNTINSLESSTDSLLR